MSDSRLSQVTALIDDARTLLADMAEEGLPADVENNQLASARFSLNVSLQHIHILQNLLEDGCGV